MANTINGIDDQIEQLGYCYNQLNPQEYFFKLREDKRWETLISVLTELNQRLCALEERDMLRQKNTR